MARNKKPGQGRPLSTETTGEGECDGGGLREATIGLGTTHLQKLLGLVRRQRLALSED